MLSIPTAFDFFVKNSKIDYLWEDTSCEIVFFYKVMKQVLEDPVASKYQFYVVNEEPLPEVNKNVIVIQVGLEDHRIPAYTEKVAMVFDTFPPEGNIPSNLKAIPLGYNGDLPEFEIVPFKSREIDAFFSGQNSHDRWKIGAAIDRLKTNSPFSDKKFEIHYSEKFRTGYPPDQYARSLMNTKIAFVPKGSYSPITFRFFEAARAGNIIISCELPDTWYFKNFPGIQINNWDDLDKVLIPLLNDPERMEEIHKQTLIYYDKYCSEKAVANYMIREIGKISLSP
ncbi:MAG: hypothetical protein ACI8P3_002902 [Saprospiraceae bacterium]|jgi:hypothetical protein